MNNHEFFRSGITLEQSGGQFRLSTDAIVLADFAARAAHGRVCDLCSGIGTVGLLLCGADARCQLTGVELQAEACALAQKNIDANGLGSRFSMLQGDLRQIRSLLPANSFDAVVCNPPYFPVGSGAEAKDAAFAAARTEKFCTLSEVCQAAGWLLGTGGSFCLVHRPERLADVICALRGNGLEPKRLRFVRHRADRLPSLLLVQSVCGGRPGVDYMPDLILFHSDGTPTPAYRRLYHMED